MLHSNNWFAHFCGGKPATDDARERMLEALGHCYVRESQHVMRLRQHAERIATGQAHDALLRIAAEDANHVGWIEKKIAGLGGKLPDVLEIHCSHENGRDYLRSDLDEERRCMAEIEDDKENLQSDFPDIVALLDRIESDAARHWAEIRGLLLRDDMAAPLAT